MLIFESGFPPKAFQHMYPVDKEFYSSESAIAKLKVFLEGSKISINPVFGRKMKEIFADRYSSIFGEATLTLSTTMDLIMQESIKKWREVRRKISRNYRENSS